MRTADRATQRRYGAENWLYGSANGLLAGAMALRVHMAA